MPWYKVPRAKRGPATLDGWLAETRATRSTCAAMASSMATLALEHGRLTARLEAVMTNGLPARHCPDCRCEEVTDRDRPAGG